MLAVLPIDNGRYGTKEMMKIFSEQNLWKKLRNNLIKLRNSKKWDDVASNLLRQL